MSGSFFKSKSLRCMDPKARHKAVVYDSTKYPLKKIGNLAEPLNILYLNAGITDDSMLCSSCYTILTEEGETFANYTHALGSTQGSQSSELVTSSEEILPETGEEVINGINKIVKDLNLKVSPIKAPQTVNIKMQKNYSIRKRKQIDQEFDSHIARKISKVYQVEESPLSDTDKANYEWLDNIKVAIDNCVNTSEKIKLLTIIPLTIQNKEVLSLLPNVTSYMLNEARCAAKEGNLFTKPENNSGHLLSDDVISKVMEYYLNDDFNCSRQSSNKNDTLSVKENGVKVKKVKRFLTRSIKKMYDLFKIENPNIKIGKSKFYELRPRWVIISPDACLCVYCENFQFLLLALKKYKCDYTRNTLDLETKLFSAIVCSRENLKCILRECENCPPESALTLDLLDLTPDDEFNEITYSIWEKTDFIEKTVIMQDFLLELQKQIVTVSVHKMIKEIQCMATKEIKILSKQSLSKLVLHVDFAENWTVIMQNEIQSYHWSKSQISIFTAVCYYGDDTTVSYAVISDDLKHDSAHALLAMDLIKKNIQEKQNITQIDEVITISDGAASHFKNRYQVHELKNSDIKRKWFYSATGHGKAACDGVGGLVKHFATIHNLTKNHQELIRNTQDFATHVQKHTPAINLLLLPSNLLEEFRAKKQVEWVKAKGIKGIKKLHCWKKEDDIFMARTAKHE